MRLRRLALTAATGIVALNIATGSPAIALWAGSQVQGSGPPTMTGVFVVVVVFAVLAFALVAVMTRISQAHNALTGHTPNVSMHVPWLRSLRGEAPVYPGVKPSLSGPERMVVIIVVGVVIAFEVWFFFFSGSPVDQRTGRASIPQADEPFRAVAATGLLRLQNPVEVALEEVVADRADEDEQ